MIKIVVTRAWWRFWRRPMWGLNRWAWLTIDKVPVERSSNIVYVDGYEVPGDGGEGRFQWNPLNAEWPRIGDDGGVHIAPLPEEEDERHAWVRPQR